MAYLQAFLILISATAASGVVYILLQYLEKRRGKKDPIAGVNLSEYTKNTANETILNYKPAVKTLTHRSTKPSIGMAIWGLLFGGIPFLIILMLFIFEFNGNPTGFMPDVAVTAPIGVTIFVMGFVAFGFTKFMTYINKSKGVSGYSITDGALIIHSGLRDTIIPIAEAIYSVSEDKMIIEEHVEGAGKNRQLIYSIKNLNGDWLTGERASWLPWYSGSMYFSSDAGDIVAVKLRDGETTLALTPEDAAGFVKELKNRIL
jgi:hypothetical protein